jgi:Na+-translocating ferredoxin:NAD+ oxidoreductase RnfG subunit
MELLRKINWSFVLLCFVVILCSSFTNSKSILKKVKKEISKVFVIEDFDLDPVIIEQNKNLFSDFSNNRLLKISIENKLLGYAYLGTAPSKTETFEYLVLFDNNFIIKKAKVLLYRESWGGEIGSNRWLKQFVQKDTTHEFKYRENISAISGATISVKSMTNAINQLLSSLSFLIQKKIL